MHTYTPLQIKEFNEITDACGCPCHTQPSIMHITECCALTYFPKLYAGRTTSHTAEHIQELLDRAKEAQKRRDRNNPYAWRK